MDLLTAAKELKDTCKSIFFYCSNGEWLVDKLLRNDGEILDEKFRELSSSFGLLRTKFNVKGFKV